MKKILCFLLLLVIFPVNLKAISASSYVVMDIDTGNVLYGSNINDSRLIASITKIMTCIITIENADINKTVTADKSILKGVGSSIYIEIGEKIKLKDLLYGMMLRSGNDAAILIANSVSGDMTKFSQKMNEYAKKIGMKNTYFYNSHGLEESTGEGNKSTAYDMALLTSYAMKNKTFREIFKTRTYEAKSDKKTYVWQNKNKLLKYDYITGGKTGYTQKARRTLVTTADIDGMNVVVVTLNDGNDWLDHLTLYEKIKKEYEIIEVISKKNFEILDDTLYNNDSLYLKNNVNVILKKQDIKNLKIKYYLLNKKSYKNKEKIGSANVYLNDKLLVSQPIYVKIKNRQSKNIFIRLWEKIF